MGEHQRAILNSEQSPQFFVIFRPDHCSTELRIPPAFIKHVKVGFPSKFILLSSANKPWEVDVTKVDDRVFFQSGWEKFVKDHVLEFGDFLVFYYNGESKFYVSICGKNNCQKEIDVAGMESERESSPFQGKETNETGEQKKSSIGDNNLTFDITIQRSYLMSGFLNLPKVFSDGVKEYRRAAKLQHLNRTWEVKVSTTDSERLRYQFHKGWAAFVEENCLGFGDVCSFKMIDIEPEFYVMNVSFSRAL